MKKYITVTAMLISTAAAFGTDYVDPSEWMDEDSSGSGAYIFWGIILLIGIFLWAKKFLYGDEDQK